MTLDAFNHAADIAIIDPTPESKNVFVGFIGEDLEMTGLTVFCDYQYLQPSRLEGGRLQFATSSPLISKPPHFFSGQLIRPRRTAGLLRGIDEYCPVTVSYPGSHAESNTGGIRPSRNVFGRSAAI